MKAMKRTILVGASMFALISGVSAQVGNTDFESFQADWKKSHNVTTELTPDQYEQMKTDWMSSTATEVSEKNRTEAEETAMKIAQIREAKGLPAGYPIMMHTGNPEADKANYEQAKAAWIANNPELYEQMKTTSTQTQAERQAIRQAESNNQNQ